MTNYAKLPTWADGDHVYAVVETPRGSRAKLEFDPKFPTESVAKILPPMAAAIQAERIRPHPPQTRRKEAGRDGQHDGPSAAAFRTTRERDGPLTASAPRLPGCLAGHPFPFLSHLRHNL